MTAKARIDNHPLWHSIRCWRNIQTHLIHQLHQEAQVPEGQMCGKEEWDKFQNILGTDYQLLVYSRDYFNTNIYSGQFVEKQI